MTKLVKVFINGSEEIHEAVEISYIPPSHTFRSFNSYGVTGGNATSTSSLFNFGFVDDPYSVPWIPSGYLIYSNKIAYEKNVYFKDGVYRNGSNLAYHPDNSHFLGYYNNKLYALSNQGGAWCGAAVYTIDGEEINIEEYTPQPSKEFSGNPKLDFIEFGDFE